MSLKELMDVVQSDPKIDKEAVYKKWLKIYDKYITNYPEICDELFGEMYTVVFGNHFSEAIATKAVSGMINEDGTKGANWTVDQTTQLAKRAGITFDKFNEWDWYYTLNMVYSDYYGHVTNDVSTYVNIAKAFIEDKDAGEGKAYRYYKAMRR